MSPATGVLEWPLMQDNIEEDDIEVLIEFLRGRPILTQSENVRLLEQEWSEWLGVRHSVFVNSGSSANLLTMGALRQRYGIGEVIVPPLTWISDIASVLHYGFKPVFADIDPRSLCMDEEAIVRNLSSATRAVFLTHAQGFSGLSDNLLAELRTQEIPLIEDVCESHGATHHGVRLGSFGLMSNFSFYYAHHMTTIEGGMICTDDDELYEILRSLRSHGLVREMSQATVRQAYELAHPDLNPEFIFAYPGYNVRGTEIGAVIGRNQLKRLDANNRARMENFSDFIGALDPTLYRTDFKLEGSCNYAFNLILKEGDADLFGAVESLFRERNVEYRRGSAGGGNQLRQPYLRDHVTVTASQFPEVEHVHFFGSYIGNYPALPHWKIESLCDSLNRLGR